MYPFFSEERPGSRRRTVYNYFYQSRGCLPDALVNKASLSYRYIVKFNMLYSHVRAQVVLQYLLSISIHKLQNQFIQFYLCFSPFPFSTFITPSESQIFSPWRQTSHLSVPFAATPVALREHQLILIPYTGARIFCWSLAFNKPRARRLFTHICKNIHQAAYSPKSVESDYGVLVSDSLSYWEWSSLRLLVLRSEVCWVWM